MAEQESVQTRADHLPGPSGDGGATAAHRGAAAHVDHDPGHGDDHGHDDDHPVENPSWVLLPLLAGLVLGLVLIAVFGLAADAPPFNNLG